MVFLHFALRFTQSSLGREGLCHRLTIDLTRQPIVGTVARIVSLVAMTARVSAPSPGTGDRAGTKVTELCELILQGGTLLFQAGKRKGHIASNLLPSVILR